MGSFNPPIGSSTNTGIISSSNSANAGGGGDKSFPQGAPREDSRMQQLKILSGPVAILWDIENCPVPGEVNAEDVAGNVRMALSTHSAFRGAVTMFSAYGDFNHFPRKVREGCQRTGINLIDVPNSKKDASDKAILVDMFLFALENRPPCTILLITGDVDFAPALHKLGQRGYTVVLAIPAGFVSVSLCSAGRYVWDWASVARGHGLVPAKTFQGRDGIDPSLRYPMMISDESGDESFKSFNGGPAPVPQGAAGYSMGFASQSSGEWFYGNVHHHHEQQQQRMSPQVSPSQNYHWNQMNPKPQQHVPVPPAISTMNLNSIPSTSVAAVAEEDDSADPVSPGAMSTTSFVQPGDIAGLKRQLVKLLSLHGGRMEMLKVPPEYCKMYGRPLYLAEYGSAKLVHLIDRMRDTVCIKGEGAERKVHLTKAGTRMAGRYKKLWGSACKSKDLLVEEQNQQQNDQQDEDEDEEGSSSSGGREAPQVAGGPPPPPPQEESKSVVVDEEVVVYVSRLDLSHESDSPTTTATTSDHDQDENDEEGEEEVIEIQEVKDKAEEYALEARREIFRQELQELLVSYAYHILVSDFLMLYTQRYCKEPDYAAFGVQDLEGLFDKVRDIAVLKQQGSGDKRFLVANVGFLPHAGSRD